jgi:hypothetical protein
MLGKTNTRRIYARASKESLSGRGLSIQQNLQVVREAHLGGITMAQLGDFARAKELLRNAGRAFGPKEAVVRVRCVVAEVEIALASGDLGWPDSMLLGEFRDWLSAANALDVLVFPRPDERDGRFWHRRQFGCFPYITAFRRGVQDSGTHQVVAVLAVRLIAFLFQILVHCHTRKAGVIVRRSNSRLSLLSSRALLCRDRRNMFRCCWPAGSRTSRRANS